jgi:hypothetical protein
MEEYSCVLENLSYSILSRIRDNLEEDGLSTPNSPVVMPYFFGINHCKTSSWYRCKALVDLLDEQGAWALL